jgi:hypothetical protein
VLRGLTNIVTRVSPSDVTCCVRVMPLKIATESTARASFRRVLLAAADDDPGRSGSGGTGYRVSICALIRRTRCAVACAALWLEDGSLKAPLLA